MTQTNKTFPAGPYRRNGLTIEVPQMGLRLATVAFSKDAPEKNVGFACPDVETAEAVANLFTAAPELLAELVKIERFLSLIDSAVIGLNVKAELASVSAAVSKAKGGA